MEKYTVLISHTVYGSVYQNKDGILTKYRHEAKKFNTVNAADKTAKKLEKELGYPCYWSIA